MYEIIHENGNAIIGELETAFGLIDTPAFMPVATKGTVKGLKLCITVIIN